MKKVFYEELAGLLINCVV